MEVMPTTNNFLLNITEAVSFTIFNFELLKGS
jgi:hypothetical protein